MQSRTLLIYITAFFIAVFGLLSVFVEFGKQLWPTLTLLSQFLIIALLIFYRAEEGNDVTPVRFFLTHRAKLWAFVVAAAATMGSLYYSTIAGYVPCRLCWFQRIFMYPLPLLLGVAIWQDDDAKPYVVPMCVIGGLIAVYHYLTQFGTFSTSCSTVGPDCAAKLTFHFGYITIPMMALTAFILVPLFLYVEDRLSE